MTQEIRHIQENSKYRIVFERGAVKGIDGFKVEANGDDFSDVQEQALVLYKWAKEQTPSEVKI